MFHRYLSAMYSTPTGFPQSTSEKKTVVDWTQKDELFPDHKGAKCFILLRLLILVRLPLWSRRHIYV